jgi:hypothetical protein
MHIETFEAYFIHLYHYHTIPYKQSCQIILLAQLLCCRNSYFAYIFSVPFIAMTFFFDGENSLYKLQLII